MQSSSRLDDADSRPGISGPLPDDADFLAATAVVALEIAAVAGDRIEGDPVLAEWVREIRGLPRWRDDAEEWKRKLYAIRKKYGRPSDAELAQRTKEQALFARVRSMALDAAMSGDSRARHFYQALATLSAGALLALSLNRADMEQFDSAVAAALSKNAAFANSKRTKVQAMKEVRAMFDEWQKDRGAKDWRTFKDFGRWAEDTHGLDAAYVARKAGRWARGE